LIGNTFSFAAKNPGDNWVEVEVLLPDGTRLFSKTNFVASFSANTSANAYQSAPLNITPDLSVLYPLDGNLNDATAKAGPLALAGNAQMDAMNLGWMGSRSGTALHFFDLGDKASVTIPANLLYASGVTTEITLEAMIYVNAYKAWNRAPARLLALEKTWNASLKWSEDMYSGAHLGGGSQFDFAGQALATAMPVKEWHHLAITINASGYAARVNGTLVASIASGELSAWNGGSATLELGNFDGWIDEIAIRNRGPVLNNPNADTDHDGLPDTFETTHGLDPANSSDAVSDWDGDGVTALQEYWLGTDPKNSRSTLRIKGADPVATGVNLQFEALNGNTYTIESNDNFPSGGWQTVSSSTTLNTFAEETAGTPANRVYRVKATASSGTNVVSELAGVYRLNLLGNSDTLVSIPYLRPPVELGATVSVSGNQLRLRGAPAWAANQWVYAAGVQTNTYFLLFRSGVREGESYTITGNTSDTLILDLEGKSLTGAASGDRVEIIPYWTLGTIFPGGQGVHSSSTAGNRPTEILIPDLAGNGINLAAARVCYFMNGDWRQVGQGSASRNDDVILPDMFFWVRHNNPNSTELAAHGIVSQGKWKLPLRRRASGKQDNVIALPRQTSVTLAASGLIETGTFHPSASAGTRSDELLVFDNASTGRNKSASATYYYYNGAWRKVGSGSTVVNLDAVFKPGTGCILRLEAGTSSQWTHESVQ
ncbi:MAG TPA: TIGR02597 family protein, partial [Verrucomicrobiae bacterium]|nr:TIGR02597 family protein [Verrucomicrobiae bacterium]